LSGSTNYFQEIQYIINLKYFPYVGDKTALSLSINGINFLSKKGYFYKQRGDDRMINASSIHNKRESENIIFSTQFTHDQWIMQRQMSKLGYVLFEVGIAIFDWERIFLKP